MIPINHQSEPSQRFSLYLQPEGDELDRLTEAMRSLAQKFETPEFVPHVTLIPERWATLSEIVEFTREIAKRSQLITIELAEVGIGETYFKCVFFTVIETPKLLLLAQHARKVFGVTFEEVPFRAHFSMVYDGEDSTKTVLTAAQKQEAAQILRDQITLPFSYIATGIAIHTSTPVVTEWQQVGFVPFTPENTKNNSTNVFFQ